MWGNKAQERERGFTPVLSVTKLSSLCKCLASTKFGSQVAMCLPARVVARSPTLTTASINRHNKPVCGKPHHRKSFATFPCGARTTIEDIILNLNLWGVEERKRTVLAGSRKRADILYPLKWKYIVFVLINMFLLCLFYKF